VIITQSSLSPTPAELAEICAQAAESKKATDISILEIGDIVGITEYFVVCSASNTRLVSTIVDAVQRSTRNYSIKPSSIEGQRQAEWVCMDYGSIVVHVFEQEARNFYRIERLFKDAPELAWRSLDQAAG
jgi:ribosome-associated protein